MGLLTGLLTLPLAPVRATAWIAEQVAEQARREYGDETVIRRRLAELELRFDRGEIGAEEYAAEEDALLERLLTLRGAEEAGPEDEPGGADGRA